MRVPVKSFRLLGVAVALLVLAGSFDHIQQRYTLRAICNDCAHTVELDVDGLATLGPDHPVPAIRKRLRCTRCGSNSCAVQLALPEGVSAGYHITLSRIDTSSSFRP